MRDWYDSVRIFGWFAPIALPICLSELLFPERNRVMFPEPPVSEHEWLRTEHCGVCEVETDHECVQFRDEPVVTRTCLSCGDVVTHWDLV